MRVATVGGAASPWVSHCDDGGGFAMTETLSQALGRRVRRLRVARGWSQEVLAEVAGVHRNYIGQVERGAVKVSVAQLLKIARALEVAVGVLVEDDIV